MLARNNTSFSCQWIKEWMGFTVKTCWETSSVLIKELDHYLDQGSSDVWRSNAVHNNLIQARKGQICGVVASSASVSRLQSQSQNLGSRWTQMKKDGLFLVLCIWTRYNNY
ncbi:hypothetical protein NC651_017059 [Populus alba x Populus x berolinensis]|nr:hypothetical protein NC651_017059 [Populus alba x Populus x berolinensis]